jgi:hypothetical protein
MDSMYRLNTVLRLSTVWPMLLTAAIITGCCSPHKSCNDIVPGAIPQPNGTYACQWAHAETARADQDKFVIYQYEWAADATQLTPYGQQHLAQIAQTLPQVSFPVVIEPSADNRINETRRATILNALASNGSQVIPDRVVFGRSEAEGLYGGEARGIASGMLGTQNEQRTNTTSASQSGTQANLGGSTGVNINVGNGSR